ncbi:MAG TPA: aminotransferase class I/II-fold pyridoxal phosphate-dependent enzyme [Dongiaceae bacterium]|jgi:aspartate/methionine/tyrosine aminotransferase|nr:aminotransferase class I/II-fold pyridoxal phosphate-dependent enzyme [Dongiaceae bacterium]
MTTDRLESLVTFHPFTRLNKLLEGVTPGGGNAPLPLHLGEPQFAPPAFLAETIAENAATWSKYPPTAGTEAFRHAVKAWLDRRYQLPPAMLDPATEILPVAGTREALFQIALSAVAIALPKGKTKVLMGNPFYHAYAGAASVAGGEPVFLVADRAHGFMPSLDALDQTLLAQTAMVYLCSPANPQGSVASLDYLKRWLTLARQHDFLIAADECYAEIYSDAPPAGALQAARDLGGPGGGAVDHLLVFHSLSKRSSAPGLRSGFVAGDAKFVARQAQLVNYGGVATPLPLLAAATRLWQDEAHVEANRARYRRNFDLAQEILGPLFGEIRPAGGFFLWLEVGDGERAAIELWRQAAIKVLPGGYMARADAAGRNPGAGYIRVALIQDPEETAGALRRMAKVLEPMMQQSMKRAAGQ